MHSGPGVITGVHPAELTRVWQEGGSPPHGFAVGGWGHGLAVRGITFHDTYFWRREQSTAMEMPRPVVEMPPRPMAKLPVFTTWATTPATGSEGAVVPTCVGANAKGLFKYPGISRSSPSLFVDLGGFGPAGEAGDWPAGCIERSV